MSFALTFAMALGSIPTDGVAYAAITNGAKTPQVETKVEVPETPATTPGVASDMNVSTTDEAKPKTVKVRFDANGGEGHMDDFEVTLDSSDWSVAETPFTRDGYRFVGWSIAADVVKDAVDDPETDIDESLTGVVLADKQEFVDLVSQKRDDDGNVVETHDFGQYVSDDVLTLYAQWEKVETPEGNAPVVDENEVVKTEKNVDEAIVADETIEDTSVVEDVDTDVTIDKELDKELLSGAFGNKTDGGVADKVGTSSPLSRKLTAPLMAAAVPSLTTQASPTGSRAGTAYAVLDSAGTLTLFRSTTSYTAGTGKTVKDVMGKTYTGQVFTGIETNTGISSSSAKWYNRHTSVKLARIADGQVIAPKSCAGWFYQCSNLTAFEGADRLDTSAVTSMRYMFYSCLKMTRPPSVGSWNTGAVTNISQMFYNCPKMAVPPAVSSWDISAVTDMSQMFFGCSSMTEPPAVGSWSTGSVTSMSQMFYNCSSMTEPPAVGSWNTSKVTSMRQMFYNCSAMTKPPSVGSWYVGSWNTSKVTDMSQMFYNCSKMTVPPSVGRWNTSAVTNMSSMFASCSAMTEPPAVGSWSTGSVTTMSQMFQRCLAMTEPPAVGSWNTNKVTNMSQMFQSCSSMTEPPSVGNWNTSAVTNMSAMFSDCSAMTEPPAVSGWNTSKVTSMTSMFLNCSSMTEPPAVSGWNTSKVTSMVSMFTNCSAMTEPPAVGSWSTGSVTNMNSMFSDCSKMTSLDVSGWDFSKVTSSSANYLGLHNCLALRKLKVPAGAKLAGLPEHTAQGAYYATWSNADRGITGSTAANLVTTVNAGNGAGMWTWGFDPRAGTAYAVLDSAGTLTFFRSMNTYTAGTGKTVTDVMGNTYTGQVYTGVETVDAEMNSSLVPWYNQCRIIKCAKIADGQVIAPKSCACWFYLCSNMTAFEGAERLDTSAVNSMFDMFWGCSAMTEPPAVGSWDTSAVTNMYGVFIRCSSMTEPPAVGNWNTSAVTNMSFMFSGCSAMTSLDVSGWDFSKVTSSSYYLGLQNCSALRELKVPAGAKLASLPEHAAQGDYAETWGNADRGITGSTAANLMSVVNAGNGAGTWTWEQAAAEYTVNFMVDGSPTAMQSEQVKADEDYTVPSCEVTKLYHDFVEWSGSDGNTYHAGDTVTAGTFAAGETLTLTAVFAPHEYGPGEFDGNLQLSVPASINFVVEPDGTLTGPSNASIINNSGVNTRVSSVEVKELGNFNFVANAEASGEQNAVELRFGPLSDMLDAASFLSKSGVDDSAWTMGTVDGHNVIQLETEGKVAHVGADIAKVNKFGEVRWFVKAVD